MSTHTTTVSRIKILVAKAGLDGHDRGAKVIARALSEAGFEVIYTGLHQTPEMVVATAIQENVDVIGLSVLSGAHNYLFPKVIALLKAQGLDKEIRVIGGGIIPEEDLTALKNAGIVEIFTPGAKTSDIVSYIRGNIRPRSALGL